MVIFSVDSYVTMPGDCVGEDGGGVLLPFNWAEWVPVSTVSLDRKQALSAAVSLRHWDLPLGVKPAVYLQQWLYGPASITQAFVSVRKHPAEPKTEPLCVDKAC